MSDKVWFENWSGQSTKQLLALSDSHRIDSLLVACECALQSKRDTRGEEAMSSEERVVLAVMALDREVNNGGFDQFLTNSSCEFAPEIEDALLRIGCPRHAAIARAALGVVRGASVTDNQIRQGEWEDESDQVAEALEDIDQRFYGCDESIELRLFAFIEINCERIHI